MLHGVTPRKTSFITCDLHHISLYGEELRIDVNSSPTICPSSPFRDQDLMNYGDPTM